MYRQGDADGSVGPLGGGGATDTIGRNAGLGTISAASGVGGRLHETVSSHTCLSSSAEYELALILKELRYITDTVSCSATCRACSDANLMELFSG